MWRPMLFTARRYLAFANTAFVLAAMLIPAVVITRSAHAETVSVLYNFTGGQDGAYPIAVLGRDAAGNFYSTTKYGGSVKCQSGCGVVCKLDPTGTETVLHSFVGGDGANSSAGLVRDNIGNLYGSTTVGGASSLGVVFKLDPT